MDREALRESIMGHEALRLYVYDDATGEEIKAGYTVRGVPTIGYGRAIDRNRGITKPEAAALLDNDLVLLERDTRPLLWFHKLDDVRQNVVAEMIYNLGLARFLGFKRMIAALAVRDYHLAACEMKASRWAAQVKGRAVEMAEVMERG